jgi:hypothetical protein
MSNNQDADGRDAAPVDQNLTVPYSPSDAAPPSGPAPAPAPPERPVVADKRVSRGWLIAAVAAGGALLLALVFAGGVATGLGLGAVTRGGFVAQQGPMEGPGGGGDQQWGPGAGPGQGRPDGGAGRGGPHRHGGTDQQDDTGTPSPSPTPST